MHINAHINTCVYGCICVYERCSLLILTENSSCKFNRLYNEIIINMKYIVLKNQSLPMLLSFLYNAIAFKNLIKNILSHPEVEILSIYNRRSVGSVWF